MTSFASAFHTPIPDDHHQYGSTLLQHLAITRGLSRRYSMGRSGRPDLAPASVPWTCLGDLLMTDYYEGVFEHPNGSLVLFGMGLASKNYSVNVACATETQRDEVIADIDKLFPERMPAPDKEEVNVQFWTLGANGAARSLTRTIGVQNWNAMSANYTLGARSAMNTLMDPKWRPTKAGQLMLWYGPPGTGKTNALRALAWEWRKWCSVHFIVDPEVFFGANANYMIDVLLNRDAQPSFSSSDDEDEPEVVQKKKRWRLLVLEDSGELMVPDAKQQTGQGLSRLLNVVDGLIGQGLRVMVLVTTNEILKKLHPAVARPGRCAARIEFGEFTKQDASVWLASQGYTAEGREFALNNTVPLAELYSLIGDEQIISEAKAMPVGFA